jgi:hypothetical protein
MNKFWWVCFGLLSITSQASSIQKTALQQLEGVWQGSGKQEDNSVWSIKITLTPARYLIDYPSLNCGGTLTLIKQNDDSLVFQENLTYGLKGCYNNGKTVLIQKSPNKIRYYWYYENNGKKAAVGELVRQNFSKNRT